MFGLISIHALRGEGDSHLLAVFQIHRQISIHALRGEGDSLTRQIFTLRFIISIHALRGEGDDKLVEFAKKNTTFQSTPSVGRATSSSGDKAMLKKHFNPRPPWGGRPFGIKPNQINDYISIHALRGEGDNCKRQIRPDRRHFNPRPPWGGRPGYEVSTLDTSDFNPRPPWGGRRLIVYI